MVITFSNIKGSTGSGGATGGTVSGITLWSDETTKAYIDNALSGVTDAFSAYTKTEDFATINGSAITEGGNIVVEETPYSGGSNIDITDHIISVTGITLPTKVSELVNDSGYITTADTQNFVTSGDVQTQINDSISGKQDTLVSGTNIKTINNQSLLGSGNIEIQAYSAGEGIGIDADNIISVTGNYETIVELTQSEYDALTSYGKNTTYVITDAPAVNLSAYTPTSGFSTINGNVITDGGNLVIEETSYTAGANIDISTDNVISVTGITVPTSNTAFTNDAGYVTSGEVESQITNKDYPTKNWVQDNINLAIASETARTESTYAKIGDIPSLDGYATTGWVESQGYITGYTETDPLFQASAASGISEQDISNWNAKLDSSDLEPYYTSAQTNIAISNAVSGKADSSAVTAQISDVKAQIEAEIPSKVSSLENDLNFASTGDVESMISGFTTSADVKTQIDNSISGKLDTDIFTTYTANTKTELNNKQDASGMTAYATTAFTESTYAKISDIPTKTSDLTNDSGFITDAALLGYATEQYVDNSVSGKVDNSALTQYYTSAQTDTAIQNATNGLASEEWVESQGYLKEHQSLSAYTKTEDFATINGSAITEGGNIVVEETPYSGGANIDITDHIISVTGITVPTKLSELTNDEGFINSGQAQTQIDNAVNGKQDTLVSGENIKTINNQSLLGSGNIEIQAYSAGEGIGIDADNIISVTGNYETIVELTQAEYDALTSYDKNTTYVITDAPAVNLSAYTPTSGFSTINGNVITDGGNIVIEGGSGSDYSAGTNIDITNHIISVTGITIPTSNTAFTNDAGYVNSGEVETQITSKGYLTGYTESDPVFQASAASGISAQNITNWNAKLDSSALNPYYTSAQTDTAISNATSGKQDTLVSGTNIKTINNQSLLGSGNIQIQGGSGGSSNIIELTQAEYDALTAYTEDAIYVITDSQAINMDNYVTTGALGSYYTSAETDTAISNAVSGKTDKISVTASGSGYKFPTWNNQGCITGTYSTAYQASQNINGSSRTLYSNSSSSLPTIYAPTSAGSAGQPLLSNGSGAPVWGAYKFQFISQSQYDALATKDSTTIYFIINEN